MYNITLSIKLCFIIWRIIRYWRNRKDIGWMILWVIVGLMELMVVVPVWPLGIDRSHKKWHYIDWNLKMVIIISKVWIIIKKMLMLKLMIKTSRICITLTQTKRLTLTTITIIVAITITITVIKWVLIAITNLVVITFNKKTIIIKNNTINNNKTKIARSNNYSKQYTVES